MEIGDLQIEMIVEGEGTSGTNKGGEDLNLIFSAETPLNDPATFGEALQTAEIEVIFVEGHGANLDPLEGDLDNDQIDRVRYKTFHYDFNWEGTRADALALVEESIRDPRHWKAQGAIGGPQKAVFTQEVFIDGNAD